VHEIAIDPYARIEGIEILRAPKGDGNVFIFMTKRRREACPTAGLMDVDDTEIARRSTRLDDDRSIADLDFCCAFFVLCLKRALRFGRIALCPNSVESSSSKRHLHIYTC